MRWGELVAALRHIPWYFISIYVTAHRCTDKLRKNWTYVRAPTSYTFLRFLSRPNTATRPLLRSFIIYNILATFRGMHVSPSKYSYAWLPRKCDYRTDGHTDTKTDRQTDAGQSDPYVPLCFAGDTINGHRAISIVQPFIPIDKRSFKANMKSYKQLEIFSCEPISKTGYWLGVCYGWFHLHGLAWAARSENRELQNEKFLPISGLELTTPDSQVKCLIHEAIQSDL